MIKETKRRERIEVRFHRESLLVAQAMRNGASGFTYHKSGAKKGLLVGPQRTLKLEGPGQRFKLLWFKKLAQQTGSAIG